MARPAVEKAVPKSPSVKKSATPKKAAATAVPRSKSPAVKKAATPAKKAAATPAKKAATPGKKEPTAAAAKKAATPAKKKLPAAEPEGEFHAATPAAAPSQAAAWKGLPDKYALPLFFFFWYAGNMAFNKFNTAAIEEVCFRSDVKRWHTL
jgi:DNA-binding protein HU-beta